MGRILIVDDEANMRRILSVVLAEDGHQISEAGGATEALALIASTPFDLVITDKKMPDGDGFAVLSACQEADPTLPVVMLTAFATVELAVEAMRMGAFDFISKPFVAEAVLAVTRRALERVKILRQNEQLKGEVRRLGFSDEILGESRAMLELKTKIARAAPTGATVLINGETGTGKELVARAIHKGSLRADETFLAVNCAAVSEQLLESELFGHEKGSFTGADRARQGLFEAAHRGTLFLDEAGEMSLGLQAKLLRVLTDGQVLRVGATVPRKVDVRILVATHRDLPERVGAGLFREDLYYRLAVIPLKIPPLRERREDIPLLVEHLLRQVSRELKTPKRERKTRAKRDSNGQNTFDVSLEMFRAGLSVEEIARRREVMPSTIETHLVRFVPTGEVRLEELMPAWKIEQIREALVKFSDSGALSPVKEYLGEDYSYGEIRAVLAAMMKV